MQMWPSGYLGQILRIERLPPSTPPSLILNYIISFIHQTFIEHLLRARHGGAAQNSDSAFSQLAVRVQETWT